jgi:hypothetical protein
MEATKPAYREQDMFVQMRSPFSRKWLKIDAEDGSIVELAWAAWQDLPHLPPICLPRAIVADALREAVHARKAISALR